MGTKSKAFPAICMVTCALFLVCACDNQVNLEWNLINVGADVRCHTAEQRNYLDGDYTKISAKGTEELSRPQAVTFSWSAENNGAAALTENYTLELSLTEDFSESVKYETDETQIDVYNLLLGSLYFWRVTADLEGGQKSTSSVSLFTTSAAAPRNLYVDGITNARDLGGWETVGGGKVKQGMIYRCGRLNESKRTDVNIEITDKGIKEMKDVLGVKTEIDLRLKENNETGGITSSPLGDDVKYVNIPMEGAMGSNCLTDTKFHPSIKRFFTLLADESNYPLAFHCDIGTDRTGFFAFLINGLSGVAEEDLYRDYLFSNFGNIGGSRSLTNIKPYVDTIKKSQGATLSEKIEYCLIHTVGVQKSEIDALRAIMTA